MGWSFSDVLGSLGDQFQGLFDAVSEERGEGGLSELVRPVDPFNRSALLTPIVTAAGVVGIFMLAGVAVGAIATTLAALLALYYLLTQVFGYEVSFAAPTPS